MRVLRIAPGEYYHVYNRGVNKQTIFHNFGDYARFLFLVLYFQAPIRVLHVSRVIVDFIGYYLSGQSRALTNECQKYEEEVLKKRMVELVAFCIMPNHFHLIVKELEEGGIAAYMQKVLTAYSKYYNTKYEKSGHIFQGPYQFVHITDDRQMKYLSTYIHRNCREITKWFKKEDQYIWSSYQDCIYENRWSSLLVTDITSGAFRSKEEYKKFVESSPAKILEEELEYLVKAEL